MIVDNIFCTVPCCIKCAIHYYSGQAPTPERGLTSVPHFEGSK